MRRSTHSESCIRISTRFNEINDTDACNWCVCVQQGGLRRLQGHRVQDCKAPGSDGPSQHADLAQPRRLPQGAISAHSHVIVLQVCDLCLVVPFWPHTTAFRASKHRNFREQCSFEHTHCEKDQQQQQRGRASLFPAMLIRHARKLTHVCA